MTTHEERIEHMVATGRVSREEGERLRAAIEPDEAPWWKKLLDPVAHLSTGLALLLGSVFALMSMGLGMGLGVRFDGALDVHVGGPPVPLVTAALEQLLAWPLVAAMAFAAARLATTKPRFVDVFNAVGLARLPLVLNGLVSVALMPKLPPSADTATMVKTMTEGTGLFRTLLVAGLTLPLIVIFFLVLVRGYRTATGLSGKRLTVSAVGFILVAEVISKLTLSLL